MSHFLLLLECLAWPPVGGICYLFGRYPLRHKMTLRPWSVVFLLLASALPPAIGAAALGMPWPWVLVVWAGFFVSDLVDPALTGNSVCGDHTYEVSFLSLFFFGLLVFETSNHYFISLSIVCLALTRLVLGSLGNFLFYGFLSKYHFVTHSIGIVCAEDVTDLLYGTARLAFLPLIIVS